MSAFDIILTILTIIGSLGVFLYGMILMSESLQKVAGKRLRKVLSSITSSDFRGVVSGLTVTGAIQSSSAVTVMIVSFVNAGLLSLRRAFSLIMGANIGTTVTAWIIVLLGFGKTFSIMNIILPLVAISLPLLFAGKNRQRSWAEFIIGFAILFLGLQFLKTNIPFVDEYSPFVQGFRDLIGFGFYSVLLFVGIGILLTMIFQSSSAVMALTFVIAVDGWIPYHIAAAMVLGENVGTTITANIAALVANRSAKRAALFHLLFNLTGVIWMLLVFKYFIQGIDVLLQHTANASPYSNPESIPMALAIFHTAFNVINTAIFMLLLPKTEKFMTILIPDSKHKGKERFLLRHIESSLVSTSELSIVQAKKEISFMASLVRKMFGMVPLFLMEKEDKPYDKLFKKIRKYESIIDRIEVEINTYVSRISENKLSDTGTEEVRKMLKVIDELESIGDSCQKMTMSIFKKNKENIYFVQAIRDRLHQMFALVEEALAIMAENLSDTEKINLVDAMALERRINELRNEIRAEHTENLKKGVYDFRTGMVFNDLIHHCEKIGDHTINITETLQD
jgi:phosphate:Na+ symporter